MKNVHDDLAVKNMSDLVSKEIHGKYGRKNFEEKETKKYIMIEREIFEKYDNLSQNELNKKDNQKVCRGENKRGEKRIGEFRKKLKIPKYEIL